MKKQKTFLFSLTEFHQSRTKIHLLNLVPIQKMMKISIQNSLLLVLLIFVNINDFLNIFLGTEENGCPLVNSCWHNVKNRYVTVSCQATSMFYNEGHRVALVEQPQLENKNRQNKIKYKLQVAFALSKIFKNFLPFLLETVMLLDT